MKLGILITTFNRPEYLRECLRSVRRMNIPKNIDLNILISDDGSSDQNTIELIKEFVAENKNSECEFNLKNQGIAYAVGTGYNYLFQEKCDVVMNLDSDAIVRNDIIEVLLKLQREFSNSIITGFHSTTRNSDGSDRHKILQPELNEGWVCKRSVGGINMMMNESVYLKYAKPAMMKSYESGGNWDHMTCINSMNDERPIICAVPSVVQHIGFDSSMNHTEEPDTAYDFKLLNLENVTLIGVDCLHLDRLIKAANRSCETIQFGDVKLLSSIASDDQRVILIDPVSNKKEYSEFMIRKLDQYIDTDFALVIQHDGYVKNANAWRKEFLDYDYIGARWWYNDNKNVGNGGFSLRSKKLTAALASNKLIKTYHPEDAIICRTYRGMLEKQHDIKFAPDAIAEQFSIEGHSYDKMYKGQFGFHGERVIMENHNKEKTFIINQFQGLGDILFSMPLIESWIDNGHNIIWPVVDRYIDIQKYFPRINFTLKNKFPLPYDSMKFSETQFGTIVPLRFANDIMKMDYRHCMRNKYDLFDADFNLWKNLRWKRDADAEDKLFYDVLHLKDDTEFTLINTRFRTDQSGRATISGQMKTGIIIEMNDLEGFTLLDWALVIQKASYIHTVHTAINYMMEVLPLNAKELHMYIRKPDEKDFSYFDYLFSKPYIYHH